MSFCTTAASTAEIPANAPLPPAYSVDALRYRLHSGAIDLSPLVVRQTRDFAWDQAHVSVYILGASHALAVALPNGSVFTELLTCLPPSGIASDSGQQWAVPAKNGTSWTREINQASGISGTVRLERFTLEPGADCLSAPFDTADALHEPFLLASGEVAWTRVGWRITGSYLLIETIHTYPEDGAGVSSASCLRLPD